MLRKYLIFLSFVLLISSTAFAGSPPGPGRGSGGGPALPPINDTPIDGGLGILLAVGVGYAVTKLKKED